MTISEFIKICEEKKSLYGDLEIVMYEWYSETERETWTPELFLTKHPNNSNDFIFSIE